MKVLGNGGYVDCGTVAANSMVVANSVDVRQGGGKHVNKANIDSVEITGYGTRRDRSAI